MKKKILRATPKDLQWLTEERKRLQKEVELRHKMEEQRREVLKLREQLHPSSKAKLKKFMDTGTELMLHLGKGMQKLGKVVQEREAKKKQLKVTVIKAK